jgi:hypothetical protein
MCLSDNILGSIDCGNTCIDYHIFIVIHSRVLEM